MVPGSRLKTGKTQKTKIVVLGEGYLPVELADETGQRPLVRQDGPCDVDTLRPWS